MSILLSVEEAEFVYIKEKTNATAGNLSVQLDKLNEAGYIEIEKGFAGKKNPDLWQRFLRVYRRHRVRFVWVKGHAETVENNRCDTLAVAAANDPSRWIEDTGYRPEA